MSNTIPSPSPSYSTAYVAKRLGVSIPTVQRWVDSGHLRAWKTVGGHRRIDAASAEAFFLSQSSLDVPVPELAPPLSVIVVDDNPDDRDILVALVETALPGAAITLAESGFEALVAVGRKAPDMLITDLVMPHMNGFEMLRSLASHEATRPRIMLAVSSMTPAQLAKLGTLPAEVQFIQKPLDPATFMQALQGAVQHL